MKKLLIVLVLFAVVAIGALAYWNSGNMPVDSKDNSQKIFIINRGEAIREVGNNLKSQGLIRDAVVFFIYVKLNNQDRQVQAGDYRLSPNMSLSKIIETLNHGTLDRWITIPEGLRAEEVADILQKNLPSFNDSWRVQLDANEGYLFPDTYLIPRDADVNMVITTMKNNFNRRIQDAGISLNDSKLANNIIIASIIQKEAKFPEDFPVVSSVIYNRLNSGMALNVDPSVAYAIGYSYYKQTGKWWKAELTLDDLQVRSAYNTYQNPGLPPAPISNPGVEAIKAAYNPANTNYFYYLSDKSGKIHPEKTDLEHEADIKKYL